MLSWLASEQNSRDLSQSVFTPASRSNGCTKLYFGVSGTTIVQSFDVSLVHSKNESVLPAFAMSGCVQS